MTPPPFDPFASFLEDSERVASPTVVPPDDDPPEAPTPEHPMTDAPSQHDDWYQSDDALSADRPVPLPPALAAPSALQPGGPTLSPRTDASVGLSGLLGSLTPSLQRPVEPSLGLGAVEPADDGEPAPPAPSLADRLGGVLSGVPIERVAPVTTVAFVCSILLSVLVRLLA